MPVIVVDDSRCTGHGRCYALVPELFTDDEEGRPIVLVSQVEGALEARALEAVAACPEDAISLVAEDTGS
jgi:ferredoxin